MRTIIKSYSFLFLFIQLFCTSCKKFVDIPPPKNQITNVAVFADSANATAAVLGIYVNIMQAISLNMGSGGLTVYTGLSSDELYSTTNDINEKEFYNNNISVTNNINASNFWSNAYAIIYQANACLEGLEVAKSLSLSAKKQLQGEAKFIRSFVYFNLINLYGDVPLVTSTDYHKNQKLARLSVPACFEQIIADLMDAQGLLSPNYVPAGRFRPNSYTATALLAKVYLYHKDWDKAEAAATKVIDAGVYSLDTDLNNVFKSTSNEAIWKLSRVFPGLETQEGYFIIPANASIIPKYVISNNLLSAFESGDRRSINNNWIKRNTINGQNYYYPFKYKLGYDGLSTPLEHYVVFRLAEQYLIRAEARARQNKLTDAAQDINVVRNRAGLPNTNSITQPEILSAIEHERQTELFCEWGNRWFDLKRTDRINAVLGPIKGSSWQPTDALYPIPQKEIDNNPYLYQNKGY
jgi:hypothetical protein